MLSLSLAKRFWPYLAAGGAILACYWAVHSYGANQYKAGAQATTEAYVAAQEKATAEHNAKVKEIDDAHYVTERGLATRLQAALDRPATRTIRVPISTVCPASIPEDAGVSVPADPAGGFVEVDDPGYPSLRDFLYRYAAGPLDGG